MKWGKEPYLPLEYSFGSHQHVQGLVQQAKSTWNLQYLYQSGKSKRFQEFSL